MVPGGSPSHGGDVAVYVFDINVLVSISVSTVLHSVNSPDNSLLSHSVLPVLFLPNLSFQLDVSL